METDFLLKELKDEVSKRIDITRDYDDAGILEIIEDCVFEKSRAEGLSIARKRKLVSAIFNSRRRYDVLQPLIDDRSVTEIMVNGPENVFIEKDGRIFRTDTCIESEERLYGIIQAIVSKVNRTVNEASPIVDARLVDGSRVNVVLPPISLCGPVLTIRKFPEKPLTINDLVCSGSLGDEAACFLEDLVKARYNIFICGGTGSGKTTFLNILSNFIPRTERIVTVEDSAELQIRSVDNIVRLETRNPNSEGKGEVTVRELIRASLRMRPDRIIVGEVRGPEALDMLWAMNTGHDGSISTGHGNSAGDMLSRLETMALCGAVLPLEAIRQQIASALDIIIHLGRLRDMSRRILEINEVSGCRNNEILLTRLYEFRETGSSCGGNEVDGGIVEGGLYRTEERMKRTGKFKMAGIKAWE